MRRMIKRSRLPHAPFFQEWDEENEVGDCELPDPSNLVPTVASGTGWRGTSAAQKSRHTKTGSRLQTPRFLCSDEDYSCNPGWVPDGSNGCTEMEVCGSEYDPFILAALDSTYEGDFAEFPACIDEAVSQEQRPWLGVKGGVIRALLCKNPVFVEQNSLCQTFFEKYWLSSGDSVISIPQAQFDSMKVYAATRVGLVTNVDSNVTWNGMTNLWKGDISLYETPFSNSVGKATFYMDSTRTNIVGVADDWDLNTIDAQTRPPLEHAIIAAFHKLILGASSRVFSWKYP